MTAQKTDQSFDQKTAENNRHWLTQPKTVRKLWWVFSAVLAATVLVQLVWYVKGYFTIDGWFGFGAVYGFLSCLLMVLFAKLLGVFLKRPNNYYLTTENSTAENSIRDNPPDTNAITNTSDKKRDDDA